MLVVTRYQVPVEEAVSFRDRASRALEVLAGRPGWQGGHVGRAADDPTLWVVSSEWTNVGSYRRALSSYEVKLEAVPLLSLAIDEPTAFEVVATVPAAGPSSPRESHSAGPRSARAADADEVGLGSAAAPIVPTDFDGGGVERLPRTGRGEPTAPVTPADVDRLEPR